jgi:DNA-binding MarR family transcriptional regulator
MDRTTLTANLKPLERDGLISVTIAKDDRRSRNVALRPKGHALLARAFPIWHATHGEVDKTLTRSPDQLRADLAALSRAYRDES